MSIGQLIAIRVCLFGMGACILFIFAPAVIFWGYIGLAFLLLSFK